MKREFGFSLIIVMTLCSQYAFSQQKNDSTTVNALRSFLKFKVSDFTGLEWEQKIAQKSVITGFVGLIYALAADGFSISQTPFNTRLQISPFAYVEYRNYYNLNRRLDQKKNIKNNSANFLYANVLNIYPVKSQNYFGLLFIQGWGMQRVLGRYGLWKKINFDCHLGITEHFYYDKPPHGGYNYLKIEPHLTESFSYIF
jgi:hypothetical protein